MWPSTARDTAAAALILPGHDLPRWVPFERSPAMRDDPTATHLTPKEDDASASADLRVL